MSIINPMTAKSRACTTCIEYDAGTKNNACVTQTYTKNITANLTAPL